MSRVQGMLQRYSPCNYAPWATQTFDETPGSDDKSRRIPQSVGDVRIFCLE